MVKLTKDGGAAGTRDAAATWTYTVKDAGDRTLATGIALQRARPRGIRSFAPAGSLGLATYVMSSLVLLDAFGEGYTTAGCTGGGA